MYTFYNARIALAENFEVANRYGSDLLDDVARWIVGRGEWVVDLPISPREADQFILANARKIIAQYFDSVDYNREW